MLEKTNLTIEKSIKKEVQKLLSEQTPKQTFIHLIETLLSQWLSLNKSSFTCQEIVRAGYILMNPDISKEYMEQLIMSLETDILTLKRKHGITTMHPEDYEND